MVTGGLHCSAQEWEQLVTNLHFILSRPNKWIDPNEMVRILRAAACTLCIHSVVLTVQTAMKSRAEAALRDVPELSDTNAISAEAFGTWFKEDIMSYHGSLHPLITPGNL